MIKRAKFKKIIILYKLIVYYLLGMSTRFPPRHFIDQVSDLVRVTVREVIDLYRGGHISREDHITGTFVSLLEKNLKDRALEGITINVKAFSLSEEKATGADFGVLLNICLLYTSPSPRDRG